MFLNLFLIFECLPRRLPVVSLTPCYHSFGIISCQPTLWVFLTRPGLRLFALLFIMNVSPLAQMQVLLQFIQGQILDSHLSETHCFARVKLANGYHAGTQAFHPSRNSNPRAEFAVHLSCCCGRKKQRNGSGDKAKSSCTHDQPFQCNLFARLYSVMLRGEAQMMSRFEASASQGRVNYLSFSFS